MDASGLPFVQLLSRRESKTAEGDEAAVAAVAGVVEADLERDADDVWTALVTMTSANRERSARESLAAFCSHALPQCRYGQLIR